MNNTCVLLSSCDKYSFAWKIWEQMVNKYWDDCPYPIYSISEEKDTNIGKNIKVGTGLQWSDCMIQTLPQIKEDIIIFLLEDYWFTEKVNTEELGSLCSYMERTQTDHIRLYVSEGSRKIKRERFTEDLDLLNREEDYRCALNAGIWRKSTLISLLESGKNIWDSEHSMTNNSRSKLFCTVKEMKYIKYDIDYNMIERGQLTKHGEEYIANYLK